ncbi:ferredoxin [Cryptosporangium minutisporangium]|uniref:Ferredoxin n=1 Tax=Cryptosporangium minutisporangium TaxID=113569 RepID=A0ABP6T2R3_9ACTN
MKVLVDNQRCEAHGQCWMVDEELFPLDDDGYSAIPAGGFDVPAGKEDVARRGVDACPLQALRGE